MTVRELYNRGKNELIQAGLDSPAFDALCLLEKEIGISGREGLAKCGDDFVFTNQCISYMRKIERRKSEPFQYILGEWEFDGIMFSVGEGVLIPREDTLTVVEAVQEELKGVSSPKILDLCAGSGTIGISLARRIPDAHVVCLEGSMEAFGYLLRNKIFHGENRVMPVLGDVLEDPLIDEQFDCIVSNPPYIPTEDIYDLQWEVGCEPLMALDGGIDGLDFYRAICDKWLVLLKEGGVLAFESGYDIADGVAEIMAEHGFTEIKRKLDLGGVERCIYGRKSMENL